MKVTVFTPTYNRKHLLERLYDSLLKQTCKEFDWLIVDDGSLDNTMEYIELLKKKDNGFEINYYYKENGGKQRAINYALEKAKGELFLVVDSDDCLVNTAIEKIILWERNIPKNGRYCGFAGNVCSFENKISNPIFETEFLDCSFFDRYPRKSNNYFFIGHDRAWVFYTNIHKKYLYPEVVNENFIPEAVCWNRMANDGYIIRCYNDPIYILEHQSDGLTNNINNIFINNPIGYSIWKNEMNLFFNESLIDKIKNDYSLFCDLNIQYNCKEISLITGKSLLIFYVFKFFHELKK